MLFFTSAAQDRTQNLFCCRLDVNSQHLDGENELNDCATAHDLSRTNPCNNN